MENSKNVLLLDCTLRDGGLGLEDAVKNGLSAKTFPFSDRTDLVKLLAASNADIVEIGSIEISDTDKSGFAIYQDMESISKCMPLKRKKGQMFAALYRGPDTPIDDIPEWNKRYCEVVRVIIRYSELQKSLDFCKALSDKHYKVSVQPMVTMRYTDAEIQMLIDAANDMDAYVLYFVDSYGYMQKQDIAALFERFDKELKPSVRIGFHAHNNMNLAFSNILTFLSLSPCRNIVVDSCLLGMGQGAGNLQTEIIADHLNRNFGAAYNYDAILDACEIIEKYWTPNLWGYSLINLLPAINKTAYKFSNELRNTYKLSYKEINWLLHDIPEDLRHRYTPENARKLLNLFGYDDTGQRRASI